MFVHRCFLAIFLRIFLESRCGLRPAREYSFFLVNGRHSTVFLASGNTALCRPRRANRQPCVAWGRRCGARRVGRRRRFAPYGNECKDDFCDDDPVGVDRGRGFFPDRRLLASFRQFFRDRFRGKGNAKRCRCSRRDGAIGAVRYFATRRRTMGWVGCHRASYQLCGVCGGYSRDVCLWLFSLSKLFVHLFRVPSGLLRFVREGLLLLRR